ncbi:NCS cytosine-purine permease [Russula earlei]|uniref:NCS cytosine-purine permease n=1 Tax=Russula earlei TaxID=71964 RepID=A0ACC0UF30_9AGAM|nr:NCS cytosine-purine permease [Russula earlei]
MASHISDTPSLPDPPLGHIPSNTTPVLSCNMEHPATGSADSNPVTFEKEAWVPLLLHLQLPLPTVAGVLQGKLATWGVEERGIHPVAVEDRTETHFIKIFFVWFSANTNILSFSTGTLGPVVFGLGLRDSCLVILFFNLLCAIPPAYLYYGTMVPSLFSLVLGLGFSVLNSILGGQALATIANISWSVGIVIIAVTSLFISFCGLKVLNWYENCAWIPAFIVFIIVAGVGGKDFVDVPAPPATAAQILDFAAVMAGFTLTWGTFSSDYTAYFNPRVSSRRNIGFCGAQLEEGYTDGNVGGLLNAMLSPLGGFGKFLVVLLCLSVTATVSPTTYSMCMAIQTLIPPMVGVPRYVFSVAATALVIVLAIVGQHRFYSALSNFLGIIGYWAGAWVAAICVEHLYFRKGDFSLYDIQYWNVPSKLPLGAAALGASILSFALVIPSMSQVWYTGPIAHTTGDIGFEFAFALTALFYIPLRHVEKRVRGF